MMAEEKSGRAAQSGAHWRTQEMLLVQQVMSLIGRGLDVDAAIREILHLLSEILGLNRGRVVLADPEGGGHRIAHAYGLTREEIARGRYAPGEGITGQALIEGRLVIVQDIDKEPRFLGRAVLRSQLPQDVVAFIALPVQVDQRVVGVLACHRVRHRDRQLSDDVTILRIMSTLIGQLLTLSTRIEQRTRALREENHLLANALQARPGRYGIIGTAPALLRAMTQIEQVAPASASVLLLGQSGTGKELFARALHLAGPRRDRPFIRVNCAAIPEALFESELFGHEKGAFTGAADTRKGWFEQASGGTIFLDEIGEMPLLLQGKLLRTLQESTVVRVGGKREIAIDARVVAATNRDLGEAVAVGNFREDLYYRLNVIPIQLPALAERRSDIAELVIHFLARANQSNQRNVSLLPDAIACLVERDRPGNVRQLSNFVERAVLLSETPLLDRAAVERLLTGLGADPAPARPAPRAAPVIPEASVRPYLSARSHGAAELQQALIWSGGNKSRAAQRLGLTERQFSYRLRKIDG